MDGLARDASPGTGKEDGKRKKKKNSRPLTVESPRLILRLDYSC